MMLILNLNEKLESLEASGFHTCFTPKMFLIAIFILVKATIYSHIKSSKYISSGVHLLQDRFMLIIILRKNLLIVS